MRVDIMPERPCLPVGEVASLPVLLRLTAPPVPRLARKPLNLCLVIDRSGSMAGEKLRQTIASVKFVVERLAPTDILSVVQFDDRIRVVIPPGPVTDRAHLGRRLNGIHAGGQTNLSGGWLRGAACVREKKAPDHINRVILLTDGQANHGIVDPAVLVRHAEELTEDGITTTIISYGEDFNEDLLTSMADAGRGNAHHVETAEQAPTVFAREAVALGDLVSGGTRSVLLTFRVGAPQREGWVGLGKITVSYDDVGGGMAAKTLTRDLLVAAMASEKVAAIPVDAAVIKELLILRTGKVLQAAIAQADAGDVKGAIQRLTDFLAVPEVAAHTDPKIQAARQSRLAPCA